MKRFFWANLVGAVILSLVLPAEISCANEIEIPFAPEDARSVLPTPGGAHAVGVRSFYWVDNTRSKTGRPEDGGSREISATVWYPAITKPNQKPAL